MVYLVLRYITTEWYNLATVATEKCPIALVIYDEPIQNIEFVDGKL